MNSRETSKGFGRRAVRLFLPLVAVAVLGSSPVPAQSGVDGAKDQEAIGRLLKRIDELEASQKQMQKKIDALAAPALLAEPEATDPPASDTAPASDAVPAGVPDPELTHTLGPVKFRGFGDVDYGRAWFEKLPPGGLTGSTHSFNIGDFDVFTNTRISEHWSLLAEMLVTSDFTNGFGVELDRFLVTYKASDFFKVSVGKFNTGIGYYPNAFHRAHFFQTATSRPIMFADEDNGGILPVHSIGVTAGGKIPSGSLGLNWSADLANGRASNSLESDPLQNFVDENNGKAVNLAVFARPEWLNGFQAGVSIYRDTLHPENIASIGQTILSAHVVYVGSKLEWLNEVALIRHDLRGQNQLFRATTSYTQLSRAFGKTRPYFRYDYQNVPNSDPIFGLLGRRGGPSFGVSRHLSNFVLLKAQYGRFAERNAGSVNDVQAQLAFAF